MAEAGKQYLGATGPVKAAHAVDVARLEAYLSGAIEGFEGPLTIRQFEGGQSNPTYRLDTPGASYVLRRKPPGVLQPSAHAVDREYRVMTALTAAGFPVARPRVLCADETIAGTMFYVMDFVEGRVFWDPLMPDLEPADRRAVLEAAVDRLADLHALDPAALGLSDYGRPGSYFERQVARWSRQYREIAPDPLPEMLALIDWLPANIPDDPSSALVHGDYGVHNLLLHSSKPDVLAVLDWELSTLGHPVSDLFYFLIPWYRPDLDDGRSSFRGLDFAATGLPTEQELIDRYVRRLGRPPIVGAPFYRAFNLFRAAGIGEGIVARARQGNAAANDAESFAESVVAYARAGWAIAERAGKGDLP
ncbi:MAG: phosphotransferase family protein [Sphingomonadaceae bacterium]